MIRLCKIATLAAPVAATGLRFSMTRGGGF
jgi:hypothetical protein